MKDFLPSSALEECILWREARTFIGPKEIEKVIEKLVMVETEAGLFIDTQKLMFCVTVRRLSGGGRERLVVSDPLANNVRDLLLSNLEVRRSTRTSERDVSAVGSTVNEDGLDGRVGDGLVDGK